MFANLSKPQSEVLAAFSFGITKAKSCAINAVAREPDFLGIPDTVETWLRRFICNDLIYMAESSKRLARSVIHALSRKKPIIIHMDETGLQDRRKAMVVSVAYAGRDIPVAAWTYPQTQWPMSQVELTTTMLEWERARADT